VRVALDTNILAYAEGVNGAAMKEAALSIIRSLLPDKAVLPVQTLGELFNVLVRKAGQPRKKARRVILGWQDALPVAETTQTVMVAAADLATDHRLGIWDAVILATTADARCRLLLSEDLQEGFTWNGVTVTNPFSSPRHPILEALLADSGKG
jgi:predicted nucleic acid-binding protein